jgi:D-glycerate 3-kinase
VNQPGQPPLRAVILEGWSVGFRPLAPDAVAARREAPSRTLKKHPLEHLLLINDKLRQYDALTDLFDAFIHIDAQDLEYVYGWRQQQEEHLRIERGDPSAGMTPEQVVHFVDGYFPAYELYTDGTRRGIFTDRPGAQLCMVVGQDRKVRQVSRI